MNQHPLSLYSFIFQFSLIRCELRYVSFLADIDYLFQASEVVWRNVEKDMALLDIIHLLLRWFLQISICFHNHPSCIIDIHYRMFPMLCGNGMPIKINPQERMPLAKSPCCVLFGCFVCCGEHMPLVYATSNCIHYSTFLGVVSYAIPIAIEFVYFVLVSITCKHDYVNALV